MSALDKNDPTIDTELPGKDGIVDVQGQGSDPTKPGSTD